MQTHASVPRSYVYPELEILALDQTSGGCGSRLTAEPSPQPWIQDSCPSHTQRLFESLRLLILPPLESTSHLFLGSCIYSTDIYCIQWVPDSTLSVERAVRNPRDRPSLPQLWQSLFWATRRGSWVAKLDLWCGRTLHRGSSRPPGMQTQSLPVTPICSTEHICPRNLEFPLAKRS